MDTQKGQLVNDAVLSVLIVSYNTRDLTLECLKSVFEQTQGVDFEVLVVDNASADGSAEAIASAYPQVELIASNENLGFGQACNLAAKRSTGRWLVLLNPDTVVLDHALTRMFEFAKSQGPRTFIGGRTFYPDGRLEPRSCSGRPTVWSTFCFSVGLASLFRRTRCFDPESLGAWERDSSREVDIIAGCLLMTSREFWDELGGFDQDFFMYGEDYDLCLRARKAGGRNVHFPEAQIIHHVGASEAVQADRVIKLFRSRAMVFRRHMGTFRAWLGVRLLDLWVINRIAAFWLLSRLGWGRARQAVATWSSIWEGRSAWRAG